jgi:hypothetical protein
MLATIVRAVAKKPSAAVAATTAIAAVTFTLYVEQRPATPFPVPLPAPTGEVSPRGTFVPPAEPSTTLPVPPPEPPPAQQPPDAPTEQAPPPEAPQEPPPPTPGIDGVGWEDNRPVIFDESVEYRKITTAEEGGCDHKPTTSAVRATVTGDLRSVTAHLWRDGDDIPFRMTNIAGTSEWHGQLTSKHTGGHFVVGILAVDVNGKWAIKEIGEIWIEKCS